MPRFDNNLTVREKNRYYKNFDPTRIYMAKVMDTRNVSRAGEILVHVIGGDSDENNPRTWVTAAYASSFFGVTPYSGSANQADNSNTFETSPKSFGSWFPMPCVGNYVFIFFPASAGELTNAYWFACPVNPSIDYMIPGIPGAYCNDEHKALTERKEKNYTPVQNKKYNQDICEGESVQAEYTPLNEALKRQELDKDGIRGYSTAGAKRERPSMCYGILTPLGNSFVMDDGWTEDDNKTEWNFNQDRNTSKDSNLKEKRELVDKSGQSIFNKANSKEKRNNAGFRFRTRNGTQILIADDGTIYMINSDGSCWVEISEDGYLDAYSEKGVNVASEGDINLHTSGNIFLEAGMDKTIGLRAGTISIETGGDLNIDSHHINTNSVISSEELLSKKGNISTFVSSDSMIKGTFNGFLQGTAYYAESSGLFPENLKNKPIETPNPELNEVTVEEKKNVPGKRVDGVDGTINDTINTRVPTHEPYCGHKKYKLDDKINPITDNDYEGTNNSCGNCGGSCGCGNNNQPEPIKKIDDGKQISNQVNTKNSKTSITSDKQVMTSVPNEQLSPNFSLQQLCYSDTANSENIINIPDDEEKANLQLLSINILEPIKAEFKNVKINSGYRCEKLNNTIGGSYKSQHRTGQAVDIEVPGMSNKELAEWIRDNLDYDQLILENAVNLNNNPNSGWVHVSYNPEKNRKQTLTFKDNTETSGLIA